MEEGINTPVERNKYEMSQNSASNLRVNCPSFAASHAHCAEMRRWQMI